jgi:NAD(P)-dependent dehydrogenase (short-subunit alcohol dehydrogenase family)
MTKNVANALLAHRIRILGLNIGWMDTPGEDRVMRAYHGAQDGWLDKAVAGRPFGRLVDPKEVGRFCAYLASDEAGLITGANIDFDQTVAGTSEPPIAVET